MNRRITRITLQNFMAHEHTVIEPAAGLTVLAGPNNCGKSAVVEALMVLASNSGKEFMMRHGTNECRIIVETSEGHTIEWRRTGATVSYVLDGRAIHRLRGGIPEELEALLMLPEVPGPDGQEAFAVHFGTQKEPIFLLDRSGRHTATFFAAFSDASRLVAMQGAHRKKVMERRAEERMLAQREQQLARQGESLQRVPELMAELQRLEAEHAALQAEAGAIGVQEKRAATLRAQRQRVEEAREKAATMRELTPPPVLNDTAPLAQWSTRYRQVEDMIDRQRACGAALGDLAAPPVLEDTGALSNLCGRLRQEWQSRERLRGRVAAVVEVPVLPELWEVEGLRAAMGSLRTAQRAVEAASAKVKLLERVPEVVELAALEPMTNCVGVLQQAERVQRQAVANLRQAEGAVEEVQAEIRQWAEEHPACPTCGAPIDAATLLTTGGHEHG